MVFRGSGVGCAEGTLRGSSPHLCWGVTKSILSHLLGQNWDRQATCNNLFPRSNARVVFNLLNTVAGIKVLPATQNFLTFNPPKILPTCTLPTCDHTTLNKLPGSLVVLNVASWRIYARTNMLRLISPQHFLLPLHHQETYNCYFQTLNFHCLATFSLHLQQVLDFTYLSLMLETCHHYPHTQTQ